MKKRQCNMGVENRVQNRDAVSSYIGCRASLYMVCMGLAMVGYYGFINARNTRKIKNTDYIVVPTELVLGQEDIGLTRAGKRRQRREQARARRALQEREKPEEIRDYEFETEEVENGELSGAGSSRRRKFRFWRTRGKNREKAEYLQERTDELQTMMLINPLERNAAGFVRTSEENKELARELSECAQELQQKGFAINMVHVEAKVKELMQEPGTMNAIARDYSDQVEEWKRAYGDKVQEIHQREIVALEQSQHIQTLEQQREELVQEKEHLTAECARTMGVLRDDLFKETAAKEECEHKVQGLRDQIETLEQTAIQSKEEKLKEEKEEKEGEEVSSQPTVTTEQEGEITTSIPELAPESETEKESEQAQVLEEVPTVAEESAETQATEQTTELKEPELRLSEQTSAEGNATVVAEEPTVTSELGAIEEQELTPQVPAQEEKITEETAAQEKQGALARKGAQTNAMQRRGKVVVYAAPA